MSFNFKAANFAHLLSKLPNFNWIASQLTPVRHDRDNFIRVNKDNIVPEMLNNFEKRPYGDAALHTDGSVDPKHTPYDVLSVIVWEISL